MQKTIYIPLDTYEEDQHQIRELQTKISKELKFLIEPNHLTKNLYEFQNMLQLQKLILQLPQPLQQKYKQNYRKLAYLYTQYLVEFSDLFQFWDKLQVNVTQADNNLVLNQLMFITSTELFDYQKTLQILQFKRILQKVHHKNPEQAYNSRDYIARGLNSFMDMTKQNLVVDKCVGCNSFFYKFHLIQRQINQKDVPVTFLYHFDNKTQQLQTLIKTNNLKHPPPTRKVIDFNQISKYDQLISSLIVSILNDCGGIIMIGCQQLKYLFNNHQLCFIHQGYTANQFHFVIGLRITQPQKQTFIKRIGTIIQKISPKVTLQQNIRIRFLPVHMSRFNKGYCISQVFPNKQYQKNFVVLIQIDPKAPCYRLKNLKQEGKHFDLYQYDYDLQNQLNSNIYQCPNAIENLLYEQSHSFSVQGEYDQKEKSFTNIPNRSIFKAHNCIYEQ